MTPAANIGPSEADTRTNFIDPALVSVGWDNSQIMREHYFTDDRKLAGGQRGTLFRGLSSVQRQPATRATPRAYLVSG